MSDFETLARDIARQRKRAETSTYLEYRKDAVANLWPLLADLVAACDERMRETEEMVAELIENTQSIVQPDLAIQIMSLIDIGDQLTQLMSVGGAARWPATADNLTRKRVEEALTAWTAAAPLVREAVQEATVELDENEGEDEAEDEDEDEDEEDEVEVKDGVEASTAQTEAQNG